MKILTYLFSTLLLTAITVDAGIKVVASTADMAYFAREIAGDLARVDAIASPDADIHYIEVRPSYMMKLAGAEVALKVGLELDLWMDRLIDGSRNNRLTIVDCSKYIEPLEIPAFKADARYGDLHRFGNPHYWIGPRNVAPITQAIVEGLSEADPAHAEIFRTNRADFLARFNLQLDSLKPEFANLAGKEVVFYHNSWPYLCEFTGLNAVGFIEPYPGVAPSPAHIKEMIDLVSERGVRVIAIEPYFDDRVPKKIAEASGAVVIKLYPSVGGRDKNESYLGWLRGNLEALKEALK
jgi:ABC-type Zn uptake system ZnuABC Zn-binding protein ZnuA